MIERIINISAAIITNDNKQFLLVRKQHSPFYMQAGGKIESEETPIQALIRELQEELNLLTRPESFDYLGQYSAPAANEKNHNVNAHLFWLTVPHVDFVANAELAQVGWYSLAQAKKLMLAPLTRDIILPIIEKQLD